MSMIDKSQSERKTNHIIILFSLHTVAIIADCALLDVVAQTNVNGEGKYECERECIRC